MDMDFIKLEKYLSLNINIIFEFLLQIKSDTKFLSDLNIFDYSLYVGVTYYNEKENNKFELSKPVGNSRFLYLNSEQPNFYYFFYIGDIFNTWDIKNKLKLSYKSKNISHLFQTT
jgi:hypothetical protein